MFNSTVGNINSGFNRICLLLCSLLFLIGPLFNVNAQKKPLDHQVYDDWQSVGKREISDDGKWSAYNIKPQEGDKWLYFQNNERQTPKKEVHRGEKAEITSNSDHAVFLIKPFYKDIKAEKIRKQEKGNKKNKDKKLSGDSLGIYYYASNDIRKIPEVKSFKLPKKNGDFVAYIQEQKQELGDTAESKDPKTVEQLVLLDFDEAEESVYLNVDQYVFSEDGSKLAFTVKSPEEKKKGKERFSPAKGN